MENKTALVSSRRDLFKMMHNRKALPWPIWRKHSACLFSIQLSCSSSSPKEFLDENKDEKIRDPGLISFFFEQVGCEQSRCSIACRSSCTQLLQPVGVLRLRGKQHSLACSPDLFQLRCHATVYKLLIFALILGILYAPEDHPQPPTELLWSDRFSVDKLYSCRWIGKRFISLHWDI